MSAGELKDSQYKREFTHSQLDFIDRRWWSQRKLHSCWNTGSLVNECSEVRTADAITFVEEMQSRVQWCRKTGGNGEEDDGGSDSKRTHDKVGKRG